MGGGARGRRAAAFAQVSASARASASSARASAAIRRRRSASSAARNAAASDSAVSARASAMARAASARAASACAIAMKPPTTSAAAGSSCPEHTAGIGADASRNDAAAGADAFVAAASPAVGGGAFARIRFVRRSGAQAGGGTRGPHFVKRPRSCRSWRRFATRSSSRSFARASQPPWYPALRLPSRCQASPGAGAAEGCVRGRGADVGRAGRARDFAIAPALRNGGEYP